MSKKLKQVLASAEYPVLVAYNKKLANVEVSKFASKGDGIKIFCNAMEAPFSPISGNDMERISSKTAKLDTATLKELVQIASCKSCSNHLATSVEIAKSLAKETIHCMVCNAELQVEEEYTPVEVVEVMEDETVLPTEMAEGDEVVEQEKIEQKAQENVQQKPKDQVESEGQDTEMEGYPEGTETAEQPTQLIKEEVKDVQVESAEGDQPTEEELQEIEEVTQQAEGEQEIMEQETADQICPEEVAEGEQPEEEKEVMMEELPEVASKKLSVNCLASVKSLKGKNVELASVGDGENMFYYMFVNSAPVAKLNKSRANASVKEIFNDTVTLSKALAASLKDGVVTKEVRASFGITPIMITFKPGQAISAALTKNVALATASMKAKEKALADTFKQTISIAALGVNKGFWKDIPNPLKEGFIKALSANGVANPERMVNAIFAKTSEDYISTIIAKATGLNGKNADFRNELAKVVEASSYQVKEESSIGVPSRIGKADAEVSEAASFASNKAKETAGAKGSKIDYYKSLFKK